MSRSLKRKKKKKQEKKGEEYMCIKREGKRREEKKNRKRRIRVALPDRLAQRCAMAHQPPVTASRRHGQQPPSSLLLKEIGAISGAFDYLPSCWQSSVGQGRRINCGQPVLL